ncbi:MAG: hypothetical protein ABH875_00115 [Candidatus Omnitrophota bacterium]
MVALVVSVTAMVACYLFLQPDKPIPALDDATLLPEIVEPEYTETASLDKPKEAVRESKIASRQDKQFLPLRLIGIYEEDREIEAFIKDMVSYTTGTYKTGDRIRGATITQILRDSVVLLKDGHKTILTLANPYRWSGEDDWIDPVSEDRYVISRRRLVNLAKDANNLIDEVTPGVNITDGRINGFCIKSLKSGGFVNQAGFRSGDVIKSINGRPLDGVRKPLEIYGMLRRLTSSESDSLIEIEIERGSETHTLNYAILRD